MPLLDARLEPVHGPELIEAVRGERLDAVVTGRDAHKPTLALLRAVTRADTATMAGAATAAISTAA
jgi:hypothetical protein